MVPMRPSIKEDTRGGKIFRIENVLKLNEQLRVNTTAAAVK
ncbi:hypothetical protein MKY92_21865 [Paenibacillus sp. FSL R5-0623]